MPQVYERKRAAEQRTYQQAIDKLSREGRKRFAYTSEEVATWPATKIVAKVWNVNVYEVSNDVVLYRAELALEE